MAVTFLMITGMQAHAQAPFAGDPIRQAGAERVMRMGLDSLPQLRCGRGPCAPATPEERSNPPLTPVEVNEIYTRGVVSGLGAHCGLDWQRQNRAPLLAHYRSRLGKTDRQMALVGFIHDAAQSEGARLVQLAPCSEQLRLNAASRLRYRG
jgi:hypothetical protein